MLRGVGLRVTQPRLAVLDALARHPHADTDVLIAAARETRPVSHQAVYDVLRTLTDLGLVRRIQPAGSVARYELRVGDNHHHVVCRTCGDVVDIDCAIGARTVPGPVGARRPRTGFVLHEAEVTYWGRCADVRGRRRGPARPDRPARTAPSRTTEKRTEPCLTAPRRNRAT